jgi:hypothetical protein
MEQNNIGMSPKPWNNLRLESDIQSFTSLIDLVNQGVEKKDKDGKPISKDDANFMIAVGTIALRTDVGWSSRHPNATNIGGPFFVNQARKLIKTNKERADEYIKSISSGKTSLPTDQADLLNRVTKRYQLLSY